MTLTSWKEFPPSQPVCSSSRVPALQSVNMTFSSVVGKRKKWKKKSAQWHKVLLVSIVTVVLNTVNQTGLGSLPSESKWELRKNTTKTSTHQKNFQPWTDSKEHCYKVVLNRLSGQFSFLNDSFKWRLTYFSYSFLVSNSTVTHCTNRTGFYLHTPFQTLQKKVH